jgi:hypothetical protein
MTDPDELESAEDMALRKSGWGGGETFSRAGTGVELRNVGRCGPCEQGKHNRCRNERCGCVCRTREV